VGIGNEDVHVLDPFVGTGNFIVRTMREIPRKSLPKKYGAEGDPELHANEVMLLPYYVASMNIEHEYYNRIGEYNPFEGICLVDTFGSEDERQRPQLFTEENTERVKRQQGESIKVIIGNPPYNAWQVNANDNNQNRTYEHIDGRVRETYANDSSATLKNALYDPYVKAIRWATDRIGDEGIVAFVTNNSFVDNKAFDGMRKHLEEDFDSLYIIDCGGNVRKNPRLSGTKHNVFGIQVGVSINLLVKRKHSESSTSQINYFRMGEFLRKEERYEVLNEMGSYKGVDWEKLTPDSKNRWLVDPETREFETYIQMSSRGGNQDEKIGSIFREYGNGVKTSKNAFVYDFVDSKLGDRMQKMIEVYNREVDRWSRYTGNQGIRDFLISDDTQIKWTRELRRRVRQGKKTEFSASNVEEAQFRPFVEKKLYYDELLLNRSGPFSNALPTTEAKEENRLLWVKEGSGWDFFALAVNQHVDLLPQSGSQCFPFYLYEEDGTSRQENVTDWAQERFQSHYRDTSITKWNIFHFVYAVLHHPHYRERYEGNLNRSLPRIPYAPSLDAF
jgi:predicted helicase